MSVHYNVHITQFNMAVKFNFLFLSWSSGVVTKMKMQRTIVIRRDYLHYIRKYNRFEKRHKNISVHLSPCFRYYTAHMLLTGGFYSLSKYGTIRNCSQMYMQKVWKMVQELFTPSKFDIGLKLSYLKAFNLQYSIMVF